MTRLAICGVGKIGKFHLENLLSLRGSRISGIFDTDRQELQNVAERFSAHAYETLEALLGDAGVDGVVVATPSSSHKDVSCKALEANKHVFVEKPLAGMLDDAKAIVDASKQSKRIVQVGFCERFNVNYLDAKRAVCGGRIGTVRVIHSSRVAPYELSDPSWELGVLDTAVHNLDLILWLMGSAPVSVLARGVRVYNDSAIPDTATILLQFENGAMAVDQITWLKDRGHPLSQCARSRMFIQGDRGSLEVDLTDRPSWLLDASGFRKLDPVIIGAPEYSGCLKLQFEYFLRSIEEGAPVLAPVEDALATERVAAAAFESLRSGKEIRLADR